MIAEARRVESSLFLEPGGPAICPATPARAKISGRLGGGRGGDRDRGGETRRWRVRGAGVLGELHPFSTDAEIERNLAERWRSRHLPCVSLLKQVQLPPRRT